MYKMSWISQIIFFFMFHSRNKFIQVWNDMMLSKLYIFFGWTIPLRTLIFVNNTHLIYIRHWYLSLNVLLLNQHFTKHLKRSSLSVGHSESRRMTDELGSRQRDLSTSSVTKRANGHWHAIIASSCRWSQREYKRQPVHRINHPFASEPSGGVSLLLFLTLRVRSFTSAGVTARQRWSRSHGRKRKRFPWRQSH